MKTIDAFVKVNCELDDILSVRNFWPVYATVLYDFRVFTLQVDIGDAVFT